MTKNHICTNTMVVVTFLAMCLALPSFMALFEGENPEWQQDEISRHRRMLWPILKDPDSLLTIQAMIRIPLFLIPIACSLTARKTLGFSSAASATFFLASYMARLTLFQWKEFQMEGPIGGSISLAADGAVAVAAVLQLALAFCGPREVRSSRSALGALLTSLAILVGAHKLAMDHHFIIAEGATPEVNALFSFVHGVEALAIPILLAGHAALARTGAPLQKGTLLTLAAVQGLLGLFYFLDSFDLSPYSTMLLGGAQIDLVSLPSQGYPEHFLIFCQIVQVGAVLWASLPSSAIRAGQVFAVAVALLMGMKEAKISLGQVAQVGVALGVISSLTTSTLHLRSMLKHGAGSLEEQPKEAAAEHEGAKTITSSAVQGS